MPHFVDDCLKKVDWASEQLIRFEQETKAYFELDGLTELGSRLEHGAVVHFVRLVRPMPEHLPLLAGDIIHNLRTALDHVVCALGKLRGCNDWESLAFPFPKGTATIEMESKKKCKGLPRDDVTLIESMKAHGGDGGNMRLYMVHELDIRDKHRQILTVKMSCHVREYGFDFLNFFFDRTQAAKAASSSTNWTGWSQPVSDPALDPLTGELAYCRTSEGRPAVTGVETISWLEFDDPRLPENAVSTMEGMRDDIRQVLETIREHTP